MKTKALIFAALMIPGLAISQNNYVSLEVKIGNRNSDTLTIRSKGKPVKQILLTGEGTFRDTLHVEEGTFQMVDGKETTNLYLKNGYDLKVNLDARQFDETIRYAGKGAEANNYLARLVLLDEKIGHKLWQTTDNKEFQELYNKKKSQTLTLLENAGLDEKTKSYFQSALDRELGHVQSAFEGRLSLLSMKNTLSPTFNYENAAGGRTDLHEFRGKYVFIDVWATWCAPCIAEIPFIKKAEKTYHDKNIAFIGLSLDTRKNAAKWQKFVKDKQLSGTQVLAENDWQSSFAKAYSIKSIPRFILIDPDGKIVSADAPRPSSPEFAPMLDALLK